MSKWTAICVIGVVFSISGAIAAGDFTQTNDTTTVVCPTGTHGSAGTLDGKVVVVCSPK